MKSPFLKDPTLMNLFVLSLVGPGQAVSRLPSVYMSVSSYTMKMWQIVSFHVGLHMYTMVLHQIVSFYMSVSFCYFIHSNLYMSSSY